MRGGMTYVEIAKALGISKARVQQIVAKALDEIKQQARGRRTQCKH